MNKLVIILNWIVALYFFILANIFFWGGILGMMVYIYKATNPTTDNAPSQLVSFFNLLGLIFLSPFVMYGCINFFRKTDSKYKYGLILLALIFIATEIYRFIFVTHFRLEIVDFNNLLFFGVPFLVISLVKNWDKSNKKK